MKAENWLERMKSGENMDLMHKTAMGDSVMVDTPLFGPMELPKDREQI